MKKNRIIARLDVKGPNVVKGIHFECLRVMGKPKDLAETYYLQEADELIYIDTVASLYRRQNLIHIIDQASESIFIPFTAGGGIRTLEDIRLLLEAGADKVAINTAAIKNPKLIIDAAKMFGSQCIVSHIEAKRHNSKKWEAYCDNGRQSTGLDVIEWAKKVEELNAGEILLSSVDMDGTENGFDLELINEVTNAVNIPVIAASGAGSIDDFVKCFRNCDVDAVVTASLLHYKKATIYEIKERLAQEGFPVRVISERVKHSRGKAEHKYDIVDYNKYTFRHLKQRHLELPQYERTDALRVHTLATKTDCDIDVLNCGINNIKSVIKGFERLGKSVRIADTKEDLLSARCIVLPGVGAFEYGMKLLRDKGFVEILKERASAGVPIFGICLGMQLLFSRSEEFGIHEGLDLIKGRVISLRKPAEVKQKGYKLPHIGWNDLNKPSWRESDSIWQSTFLKDIEAGDSVYFVHSFYPVPNNPENVIATSKYGGQEFCVAVKDRNISGVQFHPEKSGEVGLNILKDFCETNGI